MDTFRYLTRKVAANGRRLAFSQVGEANSPRVLLCLPGLLETRTTFDPLLHAASDTHGLRVISLDLCGRGDSDSLPSESGYCMSLYLSDVEAFIRQEIFGHGLPRPRLDVLGTSMGGIMGVYLAGKAENNVSDEVKVTCFFVIKKSKVQRKVKSTFCTSASLTLGYNWSSAG